MEHKTFLKTAKKIVKYFDTNPIVYGTSVNNNCCTYGDKCINPQCNYLHTTLKEQLLRRGNCNKLPIKDCTLLINDNNYVFVKKSMVIELPKTNHQINLFDEQTTSDMPYLIPKLTMSYSDEKFNKFLLKQKINIHWRIIEANLGIKFYDIFRSDADILQYLKNNKFIGEDLLSKIPTENLLPNSILENYFIHLHKKRVENIPVKHQKTSKLISLDD